MTRIEQLSQDLLFDWVPDVNLQNVRDNMSIRRPGYSFLSEPSNGLSSSFRVLSRRAFSSRGNISLSGSGRPRAEAYLRQRDRLVRHLFTAMHITSGMPARGEELRMIRWANTVTAMRNVFMFEGKIILVFLYNKANTNHNNSFYIVRRPAPPVERILALYLIYIMPFCDFLARELQGETSGILNAHLFSRHDSQSTCFNSKACSRSPREAMVDCPVPLDMRTYRQIAISMSKKHLPSLLQPFDPHAP